MLPPVANRFVAGETAAAVIDHIHRVNDRGVKAIVNLLGEHYRDPEPVESDTAAYLALIDDIADADVDACISVKPTQLGLHLGEDVLQETLHRIIDRGTARDVFVWIDMEDHTTTDATLDAFESLALEYEWNVGVCLQANLQRTADDVARFADIPGKIRLVKGAYDEPAAIAHTDGASVDAAFRALLETMFRTYDGGIAVGSHDPAMIEYASQLHEVHGTPFELQMLMGVREDAQAELAQEYEVWQYVPYGSRWFSYFTRRVMERKENVLFALRAVLGRKGNVFGR